MNRRISSFLLASALFLPRGLSADVQQVTLDQTGHRPAAFGTYLFGVGQKNENAGIWPCNFWSNFNEKNVARDLEVLKLEGGNAAILLFPFFDPNAPSNPTGARLAQLKKILDLCEANGTALTLRLGYAWDNGFSNSTEQRQVALLVNPDQRKAWYRFCEQTYTLVSRYRCFRGAFICWEDFWGFLSGASLDEPERKKWAADLHYPRDTVPARGDPSMEDYFDHFDEVLANDFFAATLSRFPGLGMEVRMDDDPIFKDGVQIKSFVHKKLFAAPGLKDVYVYWGPYMGAKNMGDVLSSDNAAGLLRSALEKAQRLSAPNAQLILSQFNYRDNTPGSERNSLIASDQVEDFIRKSSKILHEYCTGVYTWSNISYYHNGLNNGTFSTGSAFWDFQHALIGTDKDEPCASVFPGGSISQQIEPNTAISAGLAGCEFARLEFSAKAAAGTPCVVTLGAQSEKIILKGTDAWYRYSVSFDKPNAVGQTLSIAFPHGALMDDVVLSNHRQDMGGLDPSFARDVAYADLVWNFMREQAVPRQTTILGGVTKDNWIMSRATFATPSKDGRYQITLNLTVPDFIRQQTISIFLQANNSETKVLALSPGRHQLVISGGSADASAVLTVAFSQHQRLSPESPDVRELAAHLDSVD